MTLHSAFNSLVIVVGLFDLAFIFLVIATVVHAGLRKIFRNEVPLWLAGAAVAGLMVVGGVVWALFEQATSSPF
jgi:hypothetical protein